MEKEKVYSSLIAYRKWRKGESDIFPYDYSEAIDEAIKIIKEDLIKEYGNEEVFNIFVRL